MIKVYILGSMDISGQGYFKIRQGYFGIILFPSQVRRILGPKKSPDQRIVRP